MKKIRYLSLILSSFLTSFVALAGNEDGKNPISPPLNPGAQNGQPAAATHAGLEFTDEEILEFYWQNLESLANPRNASTLVAHLSPQASVVAQTGAQPASVAAASSSSQRSEPFQTGRFGQSPAQVTEEELSATGIRTEERRRRFQEEDLAETIHGRSAKRHRGEDETAAIFETLPNEHERDFGTRFEPLLLTEEWQGPPVQQAADTPVERENILAFQPVLIEQETVLATQFEPLPIEELPILRELQTANPPIEVEDYLGVGAVPNEEEPGPGILFSEFIAPATNNPATPTMVAALLLLMGEDVRIHKREE